MSKPNSDLSAASAGQPWRDDAIQVLARYALTAATLEQIEQGLINLTVKVVASDGRHFILQRINNVFDDSVNQNIRLVTPYLQRNGGTTPHLLPTTDGAYSVVRQEHRWRVMNFIDGIAPERLTGPEQARAAGGLLAKFHLALLGCDQPLFGGGRPVHDFARHHERLRLAREAASGHRLFQAAELTYREIEQAIETIPAFSPGPLRLVHGDPKISNMLFDHNGEGLCLIDLDTIARMPLCFELGDALRSWCNPRGESVVGGQFELELFTAAVTGYLDFGKPLFDTRECAALLPATLQIHLELAARFLTDAYEERYFGWDPSQFASRGEHNLTRARVQLESAKSLRSNFDAARARLEVVFSQS